MINPTIFTPIDRVLRERESTAAHLPCRVPAKLVFVTAALLLHGVAVHAQSAIVPDTTVPVRYRVINLAAGALSQTPAVNSSGQAVISVIDRGVFRAWFFDGKHNTSVARPDWPAMNVISLNDKGEVAGFGGGQYDNQRAFRWSLVRGFEQIGNDGESSQAAAIDRDGVVAGSTASSLAAPRAFRWSLATGSEELGALSNWGSTAVALNNSGLITGFSQAADNNAHAFAWTRANGIRDLGTLGGPASYPVGVSDRGEVAGHAMLGDAGQHWRAFLWSASGGMRSLGSLDGTDSFTIALSRRGQAVGVADVANGYQRGFSWTASGGMVDVGNLGGPGARPIGVNGKGQVTGWSRNVKMDIRAFLWSAGQGMSDLDTRLLNAPAGLHLNAALAIADNGVIVADSNAGVVLLRPASQETHPAPVVGPIDMPATVEPDSAAAVKIAFNDSNPAELHRVDWQWGDFTMETALVHEHGGSGVASGMHVYATAGVYTVVARVTDSAGNTTTVTRELVVADPARGQAIGSGQIVSPRGALRNDPVQSGAAGFAFTAPVAIASVAEHQASTVAPVGTAAPGLRFTVGQASFVSTSMAHMPASASSSGQQRYTGAGQFNGRAGYQYALSVGAPAAGAGMGADGNDGTAGGQFGLCIWHLDPVTHAELVDYDNQQWAAGAGTQLIAGTISAAR